MNYEDIAKAWVKNKDEYLTDNELLGKMGGKGYRAQIFKNRKLMIDRGWSFYLKSNSGTAGLEYRWKVKGNDGKGEVMCTDPIMSPCDKSEIDGLRYRCQCSDAINMLDALIQLNDDYWTYDELSELTNIDRSQVNYKVRAFANRFNLEIHTRGYDKERSLLITGFKPNTVSNTETKKTDFSSTLNSIFRI